MSNKDTLDKIEEKRQILENILTRKNANFKDKEVLEISKELDVLIIKYINEIKNKLPK